MPGYVRTYLFNANHKVTSLFWGVLQWKVKYTTHSVIVKCLTCPRMLIREWWKRRYMYYKISKII